MAERLEKWPAIRESLARLRPEIGYITLQTYYTDRAGQQVGRFDLTARMIAHWLETGPDDEDDEEGLADVLAALNADVPAFPDDDFQMQDEGNESDEEDEPAAEEEEEDAESDDDEDFHAVEDAAEEVAEEAVPQTDAYEVVSAVRKFLLATCENNTPVADTQKFRVRFYRPKGQQLWSTVIRYHSASVAAPTPQPTYTPPAPTPTPTEIALSELLSMHNDDPAPPPASYPTLPKPDDLSKQIADEARSVQQKAARSNGGGKSAPWEVQTLLHLHGLHRSYAAMVLNTTREIVKVQGQAMRQQAQMLSDSRLHADGLIDAMHVQKLAEIDRQNEYAQSQDAEATKAALGKEALTQLGLIGRVLMMKKAAQGANGHGHPEYMEGVDPAMLGAEEHAGELDAPYEGEEVAQQDDILSYMERRPDVVDTLNDPAVRAYLSDPTNVEQLRELATVMATMNGAPEPPPPSEAPSPDTDTEPANKE